jgi:hypothetical protein
MTYLLNSCPADGIGLEKTFHPDKVNYLEIIGAIFLFILLSLNFSSALAGNCKVNDSDISREYSGDCLNGLADGNGSAKGSDTYIGEFKQGNKHGSGKYTWANGHKYEGIFRDDRMNGLGSYFFENGSSYIGEYKNDKKNGFGTLKSYKFNPTGHSVNGEWIGDFNIRKGLWKDGNFILACLNLESCDFKGIGKLQQAYSATNGVCKVNDSDISREYSGGCFEGLADGKGNANGRDKYLGEFKQGNKHGFGTYDNNDNNTKYVGEFKNDKKSGFGIMTGKYELTGLWENEGIIRRCSSKASCEADIRLEALIPKLTPLIRNAESGFRCEEAKRINQELEAVNAGIFSFDSCVSERKFNSLVMGSDPQSMYLAAGRYESDGERSRAKTIYRQIVDRFSKNPLAIKASDRLTRLADVESVESSNSNAAYQVERSNNQSREASYQQCMNRYSACMNSCNYKTSCTGGCSICTK